MSWEANERYKRAYRNAVVIVEELGGIPGIMTYGQFAEVVLKELDRQKLGDGWDEAVKQGVVDYVHGRPMKY